MRTDHEDAVLRPRIFRDDVVEREFSSRSLCGEAIDLHRVALEMAFDVALDFFMTRRPWRARTDSNDLFHILKRLAGTDTRGVYLRRCRRRSSRLCVASRWLRLSRFA